MLKTEDSLITDSSQIKQQNISYCGINAHFQNWIAEKKIHDLQEQTCTMMLYAINKWQDMVMIHLWPYGLCTVKDIMNSTLTKGSDTAPDEMFAGVEVQPKLRHYHTFGCPTFVVDNRLQSQ